MNYRRKHHFEPGTVILIGKSDATVTSMTKRMSEFKINDKTEYLTMVTYDDDIPASERDGLFHSPLIVVDDVVVVYERTEKPPRDVLLIEAVSTSGRFVMLTMWAENAGLIERIT